MILAQFESMSDGELYNLPKDTLCSLIDTYQTTANVLNTLPNRNPADSAVMIHRFKAAATRAKRILGNV